jgi:rubrerythrin
MPAEINATGSHATPGRIEEVQVMASSK